MMHHAGQRLHHSSVDEGDDNDEDYDKRGNDNEEDDLEMIEG